jgi:hypothetical protein
MLRVKYTLRQERKVLMCVDGEITMFRIHDRVLPLASDLRNTALTAG